MRQEFIEGYLVDSIKNYALKNSIETLVVGVSGGIDSAVTSTLSAKTGLPTILVYMPVKENFTAEELAEKHMLWLQEKHSNVSNFEVNLSMPYMEMLHELPFKEEKVSNLTKANMQSRMRMVALYAIANQTNGIVVGTGNKVEDYGVKFFTKYGDGGVDISPIGDLNKTQVRKLASHMGVSKGIVNAVPSDGLWEDGRSDEDQLGASYEELEWAMEFSGDETKLNTREEEVLKIYRSLHKKNMHKMEMPPVFEIPKKI